MQYAIIEGGQVVNIIWLSPDNAGDFPAAVALGDIPAGMGDGYADGQFSRGGKALLTPMQTAEVTITELTTQACTLAEQVIDLQIALAEAGVSE